MNKQRLHKGYKSLTVKFESLHQLKLLAGGNLDVLSDIVNGCGLILSRRDGRRSRCKQAKVESYIL